MAKLGTAYVDIIGNFAPLNKSIAANKGKITGRLAAIGKAGALAGAALGVAAVKSNIDFEHAMTIVQTQAGASRKEVEKLSDSILNFASSGHTEFTPKDLADALFRVSSAGIHGAKAMATLKASSDLATIGQADLEDTTKSLVAAQKTGIKGSENLKKAIGTLNATVGSGQLKLEDLVSAMGTGLLGPARAVGLTLTDVGGALAELTKQGQPAAASATRLRMTFLKMAAPTDSAKEALKGIGLGAETLATDMRKPDGLMVALEDLREHLDGLSQNEKVQVLTEAFGGAKSGSTIITLLKNLGDLDTTLGHIRKHSDEVNASLARAREDPQVRLHEAYSQLSAILVRLGAKIVPTVVDGFSEIASIISSNKLTPDDKFSKITQLISKSITDAIPGVTKAALGLGGAVASGIAKGFIQGNTVQKLFIGAALIRLIGGKGALTAIGVTIGRFIGIGVGAGMAEGAAGSAGVGAATGGLAAGAAGGAGAKTLTGRIIGSEAGVAAGTAAGSSWGSSFLSKAGGFLKNVKWARVGGLGIGLTLADATINEFKRRSDEKSGDIFKELQARSGHADILGFNVDVSGKESLLNKLTGFNPLAKSSEDSARKLQDALDKVGTSQQGVSHSTALAIRALADQAGVTDEARASMEKFLGAGHGFKDWRDQLRAVASDRDILKIQDGFDFLRSNVPSAIKDITKVVKFNSGVIANNLGKGSKQGRKAMAENFRLAAKSIKRGMDDGRINVKKGQKEINKLLRSANVIAPTRKMAKDFGRTWAKGMLDGKKITQTGVSNILDKLKGLDKGSRAIAVRSLLGKLRVLKQEHDISDKTYSNIKSKVLSTFTDINVGGKKKTKDLSDGVSSNYKVMSTAAIEGLHGLSIDTNKILESLGVKKGNFVAVPSSGKKKQQGGAVKRQTGGGVTAFDVGGQGSGDKVPVNMMLEPGERGFILNRTATRVADTLAKFNKKFSRFQTGGGVERTIEKWFKSRHIRGHERGKLGLSKQLERAMLHSHGAGRVDAIIQRWFGKRHLGHEQGMASLEKRLLSKRGHHRVGRPPLPVGNRLGGEVQRLQSGGFAGMQPGIVSLVKRVIQRFGGSMSSGLRPGDSGFHGRGLAADWVGGDWSGASRYVNSIGPQLLEGIHQAPPGSNVSWDAGHKVSPSFWGAGTWAEHVSHIHMAVSGAVKGGIAAVAKKIKEWHMEGPEGALKTIGQGMLDKAHDAANAYIAKKTPAMSGDISFAGLKGPWVSVMKQIAKQRNWSFSDWMKLVQQESGGNPAAVNPSSGAFGLGQFLGATKAAYAKFGATSSNPVKQIEAMAKYISDRYGTPTKAWAHEGAFNWYKEGGEVEKLATGGGYRAHHGDHSRKYFRTRFKAFRGWGRHHGWEHSLGTGAWVQMLADYANAKGISAQNLIRLHGQGVGDPDQWRNRWSGGGMIEPILGSLRSGGLIGQDGAYHLHAGELVVPGFKRGGKIDLPKETLHGIVHLLNILKGQSGQFDVHFAEKDRKLLHKLLEKQEKGKLSDAEKKRLKDLEKSREKARREAKHERRQFAHLMTRVVNANGIKQVNAISKALKQVGAEFTKHDQKRLHVLRQEQRHHGLTDQQKERLDTVKKLEAKLREGGVKKSEEEKLGNLKKREVRLESHRGGLSKDEHRELHDLMRQRKLVHQEKLAQESLDVQRKLIDSNKALQTDLKEHNKLARTARANRRDALEAVTDLAAHQIGARGAQKKRNAGWGIEWRY